MTSVPKRFGAEVGNSRTGAWRGGARGGNALVLGVFGAVLGGEHPGVVSAGAGVGPEPAAGGGTGRGAVITGGG